MKDTITLSYFNEASMPSKLSCKALPPKKVVDLSLIKNTSVLDVMKKEVQNQLSEDSFFVSDIGDVYRQFVRWERAFPNVTPFFAIKSNPDPHFLQLLASLGGGFDCASKNEIQQVLDFGVDPSRIVYANPCKPMSHIRFAASKNVRKMTFDNADELRKIKLCHPNAQVVLRILTDDSKSVCRFGVKFGASLANTYELLRTARELDLDLIGVSFHVGSGCFDAESYTDAIRRARVVFDQASEFNYKPYFLDIGGGFPGANTNDGSISLEQIAEAVHKSVELYFPEGGLEIISEPGRYFVASALTLSCNITSRRVVPRDTSDSEGPKGQLDSGHISSADHPSFMYYINDGVYGSFNCIIFDHVIVDPHVLVKSGHFFTELPELKQVYKFETSLWGPSCDSLDVISKNCLLPELDVNDWLYFSDMGAYTTCAASEFNGYSKSRMIYTNTEYDALSARLGF